VNFPEKLLEGQVENLQILLKNQEYNNIKAISLSFSHGFLFGKTSLFIEELLSGTETQINL
jgi:hypothetical protein